MRHKRFLSAIGMLASLSLFSPVFAFATAGETSGDEPAVVVSAEPDEYSLSDFSENVYAGGTLVKDATALEQSADGTFRVKSPQAGGQATGLVPSGLEKYYEQKIISTECVTPAVEALDEGHQCGWLIVPIDYQHPENGDMALGYYRASARSGNSQGSIVFNYGGPGHSTTNYLMIDNIFSETYHKLNENYDLVAIDQRGVAGHQMGTLGTLPFAQCSTSQKNVFDYRVYSEDAAIENEKDSLYGQKYVNSCFEYSGKYLGLDKVARANFLRNMTTEAAARDMDILRSVVGDEKLNYMGVSYGTKLGYIYAQTFPQNVGRFVYDAVLDPHKGKAPTEAEKTSALSEQQLRDQNAHYLEQGAGFQSSFEEFAQWCHTEYGEECALARPELQPNEGDLADDSPEISVYTKQMQNLIRPLLTKPIKYEGMRQDTGYSFFTLKTSVRGMLYAGKPNWKHLNSFLTSLAEQVLDHPDEAATDFSLAGSIIGFYSNYSGESTYARSAFNAINCADMANPKGASLENATKVENWYYDAAPFVDPGEPYRNFASLGTCDRWPFEGQLKVDDSLPEHPASLIVANVQDPATPIQNAIDVQERIGGDLVKVAASGHASFDRYQCATDIMITFLTTGNLPAEDGTNGICAVVKGAKSSGDQDADSDDTTTSGNSDDSENNDADDSVSDSTNDSTNDDHAQPDNDGVDDDHAQSDNGGVGTDQTPNGSDSSGQSDTNTTVSEQTPENPKVVGNNLAMTGIASGLLVLIASAMVLSGLVLLRRRAHN
ncbi:alpha/beta fold hydrolase [Arcanobacterium buesumense]|uniref:Alpha/beta fold hydrolase n=1 Tax=Arcanobacterium buesumense TaxID=2722751 RepID=A0A6H2ELG1_9ACTO|nr:alpha/beta fold hydrolase [Arcanobacterium buesumense]QJC21887.1 alpha/beta fold hydrolase [Arcanobacterium buesumense]